MPLFREPPKRADRSREAADGLGVRETGGSSTITAKLNDGPLEGRSVQADPVEGRPPKTIDVPAADGSTCRYCLAEWSQTGASAAYTFLYEV